MLDRAGTLVQDLEHDLESIEVLVDPCAEWTFEIIVYVAHGTCEVTTYESELVGTNVLWQPCRS